MGSKKGVWALLMSFCFLFLGVRAFGQEKVELSTMLTKVKPAVVLIVVQVQGEVVLNTPDGPQTLPVEGITSTGSGFIINPRGYLVTNGHVVQLYHENNEEQLQDFFLRKALLENILGAKAKEMSEGQIARQLDLLVRKYRPKAQITIKKDLRVVLSNRKVYPAEVKAYSPPIQPAPGKMAIPGYHYKAEAGKDISILKIEDKDLPIVVLGDSDYVQLGEPVYIVGYPGAVIQHPYLDFQIEPTVTTGTISGVKVDVKGMPVIQTDAPITWGNSGGPAFNHRGEVIGVATFTSIVRGQAIQGFNFLVPINTVKEFIRASGVPMGEESLFNRLWEEALELYSRGEFKAALAKLDEVNRLHPNFPDVLKLQKEILRYLHQEEKAPSEKKGTNFVLYIVAAGLLVLVVGGFIFWQKKAPKEEVAAPSEATRVISAEIYGVLVGEEGPVAGKVFKIGPKGLKIGRDPAKNEVVIPDDRISREHAWVGPEGEGVIVKDLGSSNGTFVNDTSRRITKQVLKEGDVIILGKGRFASLKFKQA